MTYWGKRELFLIIIHNPSETGEEMGISPDTVNRYKKAFRETETEEPWFLISVSFNERHGELIR